MPPLPRRQVRTHDALRRATMAGVGAGRLFTWRASTCFRLALIIIVPALAHSRRKRTRKMTRRFLPPRQMLPARVGYNGVKKHTQQRWKERRRCREPT